MVGIYRILSPTGRVYVGQTIGFDKRSYMYRSGRTHSQRLVHRSLKKYGFLAHSLEMIHELPKDVSRDTLNVYEKLYFDIYKDAGYSMLNIREPGKCGKVSDATKEILSAQRRGRKLTDEWKEKVRKSLIGNKRSLGRKLSNDHRKKISASLIGNKRTLGYVHSEKTRAKHSERQTGRRVSAEAAKKISDHHFEMFKDESYRESRRQIILTTMAREFGVFSAITGEMIGVWKNHTVCAKELDVPVDSIRDCLNGRQRAYKKSLIFKYIS